MRQFKVKVACLTILLLAFLAIPHVGGSEQKQAAKRNQVGTMQSVHATCIAVRMHACLPAWAEIIIEY